MDDEHEDDDENDDDSRTERDASAGEPSHGVDEERAGEPVPADEKPSRDVGDQPDESGERQGEIMQPNANRGKKTDKTRDVHFMNETEDPGARGHAGVRGGLFL